jgi:hypothetical protein
MHNEIEYTGKTFEQKAHTRIVTVMLETYQQIPLSIIHFVGAKPNTWVYTSDRFPFLPYEVSLCSLNFRADEY